MKQPSSPADPAAPGEEPASAKTREVAPGVFEIFLPLPSTPSLDRQTVYLQGFAEDSGAPFGYSMTPGLQVTLYR